MKLTYSEKFKDNNPQDTINIIQNYFQSLGMEINIMQLQQSISSTWTCRLELLYKGKPILAQNGKGTTKEFCLASGHGELYERFCTKLHIFNNPFLIKPIMEKRYEKFKYYFCKDEKVLTFEDVLKSSKVGQMFLKAFQDDNNTIKQYIDNIVDNKYIGVPYQHSFSNKTIYLEPRLSMYLHGSSGLACGNSFFEAFNQGMSEIYEHSVVRYYYNNPQEKYYYLNLNNINNDKLKNIINEIQKENYLYIIDFSYNFNVPVLMSLIINKFTHSISINFGSFPVFEIALERVLTELYQGFYSFNYEKLQGQFPWKSMTLGEMQEVRNSSETTHPAFNEDILFKLTEINSCSKVFLTNKNYSNEEIYNYILSINQKENYDIYYYNHSPIDKMYAIELFDIQGPQYLVDIEIIDKELSRMAITNIIELVNNLYLLVKEYIDTQKFNLNDYVSLYEKINLLSPYEKYIFAYLQSSNWLITTTPGVTPYISFMALPKVIKDKQELINCKSKFISNFHENPYIYDQLVTYSILYRYAYAGYPIEELLSMANNLCLQYTFNDIIYLNDDNYWLEKILLADIQNIFTEDYNSYINILALNF